uniref:Uncharacterized protein n=1 Tax=Picea glauca TaxID=3330 RepID=A0A101LVK6_PICGL|nr:hypothetical protein ABT39_MTgene1957 [Picea glauca]QHR92453.1 hypothetical protein Q903MT_gene6499 [Picea sitchensis]
MHATSPIGWMSDFVPLPLVESSLPHPRPFWVESLNVPHPLRVSH